jgi:peptidoglycan/xylan/chitin deacetylase (PgdA/CDA1 family)
MLRRLPFFRHALFYVETTERVVALTLDDGPDSELTQCVLKTLEKHNAHATFFLLGEAAQRNRDIVDQIATQGHELGNHTCIDESSDGLSEHDLRQTLSKTHTVLTRGGRPVRLFRPGGGWLGWRGQVAIIAQDQHDYRCVLGSVYPNDVRIWSSKTCSIGFVAARSSSSTRAKAGPGSRRAGGSSQSSIRFSTDFALATTGW